MKYQADDCYDPKELYELAKKLEDRIKELENGVKELLDEAEDNGTKRFCRMLLDNTKY